jgi:hypothetical protein
MHRTTGVVVSIGDASRSEVIGPAVGGNDLTIDHSDSLGNEGDVSVVENGREDAAGATLLAA